MPNIRVQDPLAEMLGAGLIFNEAAARPWRIVDDFPPMPQHLRDAVKERFKPIKVVNNPELWNPILAAVREIYEPAYVCIAGGIIRDYLLGENPKDVDVFMNLGDKKLDLDEIYEKAQELGWQQVDLVGNAEPYLKDAPNGKKPLTVACLRGKVKGVTVDLLVTLCKTGREIVEGFDFHMCEHWYDGEVHSTPLGKVDIQKKQWTPSRPLTDITKGHFDRVNERCGGKYKLNMGEPWYMQFKGKEQIK
jgi:hypothetical protein